MNHKKLHRSEADRVVAGVAGGLGQYFDIDPTVVRIVMVAVILLSGVIPGLIAYVLFALVIPSEGKASQPHGNPRRQPKGGARRMLGLILVLLGFYLLVKNVFPFWHVRWDLVWPLVVVFLGFWILAWPSSQDDHQVDEHQKPKQTHHIAVETKPVQDKSEDIADAPKAKEDESSNS